MKQKMILLCFFMVQSFFVCGAQMPQHQRVGTLYNQNGSPQVPSMYEQLTQAFMQNNEDRVTTILEQTDLRPQYEIYLREMLYLGLQNRNVSLIKRILLNSHYQDIVGYSNIEYFGTLPVFYSSRMVKEAFRIGYHDVIHEIVRSKNYSARDLGKELLKAIYANDIMLARAFLSLHQRIDGSLLGIAFKQVVTEDNDMLVKSFLEDKVFASLSLYDFAPCFTVQESKQCNQVSYDLLTKLIVILKERLANVDKPQQIYGDFFSYAGSMIAVAIDCDVVEVVTLCMQLYDLGVVQASALSKHAIQIFNLLLQHHKLEFVKKLIRYPFFEQVIHDALLYIIINNFFDKDQQILSQLLDSKHISQINTEQALKVLESTVYTQDKNLFPFVINHPNIKENPSWKISFTNMENAYKKQLNKNKKVNAVPLVAQLENVT